VDDRSDAYGARQLRRFELSIPVPKPRPYLDAREAFLRALFDVCWSAYHLNSLLFDIINLTFQIWPTASADAYIRSSMRWSVSSLVVAFPVFLYMSWLVGRDIAPIEQAALQGAAVAHLHDAVLCVRHHHRRCHHAALQPCSAVKSRFGSC
jgi:hypothetical protein